MFSFITLLITSILLMCKKYTNAILVYSFSLGFAGFFSALFIALFTPDALARYMAPALPLSLLATTSLLAFIINLKQK